MKEIEEKGKEEGGRGGEGEGKRREVEEEGGSNKDLTNHSLGALCLAGP